METKSCLNMFDLSERIALVVGSGGIGGSCAKAFADFGAKIALLDYDEASLQECGATLGESLVYSAKCDITDLPALERVVQEIFERFGHIDILLNSVAVTARKHFMEIGPEEWRKIVDVNLNGAYNIFRAIGPVMMKQKHGKIIQISSTGAFRFGGNFSAYGASKAGMVALTKSVALDWAPYNIQVNAIAPTATDTKFTHEYYVQNPDKMQATINNHPYKRLGTPEDYIGAAVYLASPASDFVNGEVIVIDSGKTI